MMFHKTLELHVPSVHITPNHPQRYLQNTFEWHIGVISSTYAGGSPVGHSFFNIYLVGLYFLTFLCEMSSKVLLDCILN